jgi:hypothetical protein
MKKNDLWIGKTDFGLRTHAQDWILEGFDSRLCSDGVFRDCTISIAWIDIMNDSFDRDRQRQVGISR